MFHSRNSQNTRYLFKMCLAISDLQIFSIKKYSLEPYLEPSRIFVTELSFAKKLHGRCSTRFYMRLCIRQTFKLKSRGIFRTLPVGNFLFKLNNINARTRCEICPSGFILNSEYK